jgi:hypothetical protein
MFHDFGFEDDGRRVTCTRGVCDAAAGVSIDSLWWYLAVDGASPVRLRRSAPGETHRDVWETALRHLDKMDVRKTEVLSPES